MKKLIISQILSLALIVNPLSVARAQNQPSAPKAPSISQSMSPDDLKNAVTEISYSLENIEESLKDIEKLAGGPKGDQPTPVAAGLSKAVVAKIASRFKAAVELQAALMMDTQLDVKTREGYINTLNGHLGGLFFKVLRFHGEDLLGVDKKYESPGKFQQTLREIMLDAKTMVTFKQAAINSQIMGRTVPTIVWGPADRVRRNQLMAQIVPSLERLAKDVLPQIESQRVRSGAGEDFWVLDVLTKGVTIRQERIFGQKAATAAYMGLAAMGFIAPFIDVVGLANGGRTDLTLDHSAMIYFTTWLTIGLMKAGTFIAKGTKTTIKMLEGLVESFKAVPDGATLPERLKKVVSDVRAEKAAKAAATAAKSSVSATEQVRTERAAVPAAPSASQPMSCPGMF